MVNIQTDGSSIKFTFTNSDHYLMGNGDITVPKNSLILVLDQSEMVTFKKSDGDQFLSFPISESNFASKAELEEFFKTQMCAGNASSSIVNMYVGCGTDYCDPDTGEIHRTTCDKMDNLNIVYVDTTMHYEMVHVSLSDFILENEFADGLYVDSGGTVHGQVDPRSEEVYTAYDISGNPSTSASVLSVNESGFTVDNIQTAIDGKTLIDRRLYTPKEGVYDNTTQRITFKSDLNDSLFEVQLTIDPTLDSGSTNAVANSAITNAIDEIDSVTSAALNDLNVRIIDVESAVSGKVDTSTFNTYSGSVETALNGKQDTLSAGTGISIVDNVISATGGGGGEVSSAITSGDTNAVAGGAVYDKFDEVEQVTAAAFNTLYDALGGMKIVKLTESEYTALTTKDSDTLYVVIPNPSN